MKKTLIALAVAASAAVSGSAMAWVSNSSGGTIEIGGTLTPVGKVTPWEAKTGGTISDVDAEVQKGQKEVKIHYAHPIEILGIRTKEKLAFAGVDGVAPQIDFGGVINTEDFVKGETQITLTVDGVDGNKIGMLKSRLFAQAFSSEKKDGAPLKFSVYADKGGMAFYGGLGQSAESVSDTDMAGDYMPDAEANWDDQGAASMSAPDYSYYSDSSKTYSGFYFSAIKPNESIDITLDKPVPGDAPVKWKASLPVIVTYM